MYGEKLTNYMYGNYKKKLCAVGEFLLRLRQLEKSLLSALNEAKGRILDDDSIITHLETLKHEAEEIAKRVEETDVTMAEVETTSQQYIPLAQSCSSIYFTLESLNQVSRGILIPDTSCCCSFVISLQVFSSKVSCVKFNTGRSKIRVSIRVRVTDSGLHSYRQMAAQYAGASLAYF